MDVFDLQAKISLDTKDYESGLNNASKKSHSFASKLGSGLGKAAKVGATAMTAVGTAATVAGGALVKGVGNVAEFGDNIDKMSQKMGISAKAYQEWDAIMQHSGTSIDALKPSMKTLANAAENGSEAFQKLGISQEEVKSLSQEDLFSKVITGLQNMEEGTERTTITSKLLGRGATELGALLNTTAEDTEKMRKTVHELGGVMSDEAVKSAAAYQDQLQDMKTAFTGVKRSALGELMPALTTVMGGLTDIFAGKDGIGKVTEGIESLTSKIMDGIPKVLEVGGQIVGAIGKAIVTNLPSMMDSGVQIVMTLATSFVNSLPTLMDSGAQILTSIMNGISKNLPTMAKSIVNAIGGGIKSLMKNLPSILQAGVNLLQGLVKGITQAIPKLADAAVDIVTGLTTGLAEQLPNIVQAALDLIVGLADGFLQAIPDIVAALPDIISAVIDGILGSIPLIVQAGVDLLTSLVNNLPDIISSIVKAIPEIITGIVNAITNNIPMIIQAGIDLLTSLVTNLPQIIFEIVKAIPQIIASLVGALIKSIPQIISAGLKLLGGIGTAIVKFVVSIPKKVGKIISKLIEILKDPKKLVEAGKALFNGLWDGIKSIAKKIEDWAPEWLKKIADILAEGLGAIGVGMSKSQSEAAEQARGVTRANSQKVIEAFTSKGLNRKGFNLKIGTDNVARIYDKNGKDVTAKWVNSAGPAAVRNAATRDLGAPSNGDRALSQNDFDDGINRLVDAINKSGNTTIQLNNREVGRMVRKYA